MPSIGDSKRPRSATAAGAAPSAWSDEGLDAFAGPAELPERRTRATSRPDRRQDVEALAEFEAAPPPVTPPPAALLLPPDRQRGIGDAARLGLSVLCLGGAIALGLGYLWPDRAPDTVPEPGQKAVAPWWLGPAPPGETAGDRPPATAAEEPARSPMAPPQAAIVAAQPQVEAARQTEMPAEPAADEAPALDALAREAALDASPVGTWSALPETAPATPLEAVGVAEEPPSVPAPSAPPDAEEAPVDRGAIERLLRAYEDAHDRRDAAAVAALWPTSDEAGLTRAFGSVKEQDLSFDQCTTTELTTDHGIVVCPGEIRYVRLVGGGTPQIRKAVWTISVARTSDHWSVQNVVVR